MASQYGLPRKDTLTGSDQPGPRAFVVHHTGGGSSAKNIVDYWRANRPGIGTQYIMDRDGNIHSVKDEFGYSGTSHVSGKHTPEEFKAKGLTNRNMLGIEIMAKNDKDVTPKQAKAFAEFMAKNYPQMPIYGHGELNPGHREKDEGQTAKAAALALRSGTATAATGAAPQAPMKASAAASAELPPGAPATVAAAPTGVTAEAPAKGGVSAAVDQSGTAGKDPDAIKRAFLKTLARGEATGYDALQGSAKFKDFSKHPGTGVAGLYQFKPDTWNEEAGKYGYKDFKPETQDTAAWNYARDSYSQKTGRKLEDDLASNDPKVLNNVSTALSERWTSLPGGAEPNSNWKGRDFASVYGENLGGSDKVRDPTQVTTDVDTTPPVTANAAPVDTSTSTADASSAVATPSSPASSDKGMSGAGDIFSGIGDIFAKGPVAQNAATKSGPANVPIPQLPTPPGIFPTVDARQADMQRQQLAMAMQRLNSGRLY